MHSKRILTLSFVFVFINTFAIIYPQLSRSLTSEGQLINMLGEISLLISSILLFILFFRFRKKKFPGTQLWFLGLSIFLFIAYGEEISWGQHYFEFTVPEAIAEKNQQNEFNIHNLDIFHGLNDDGTKKTGMASWLTAHRIFYILLFGYLVVIPTIYHLNDFGSNVIKFLRIPVPPIYIGLLYLLSIGITKFFQYTLTHGNHDIYHTLAEIMETHIEFVLLLLSLYFFREHKINHQSQDA